MPDGPLAQGTAIVLGRAYRQPAAGFVRQFGIGSPGTGGLTPLLGATGPARPGATVVLRLRDGLGGATAGLSVGFTESSLSGVPVPGLTAYNWPWAALLPLTLPGGIGQAGAGHFDLSIPVPTSLADMSFFLQFGAADPLASSGISVSRGLEVHVGH